MPPGSPPPSSTPAPGPGSGDGPSPNHAPTAGALYTPFKERCINGSLLIRDVEVQAAACRDRADQGLQLRGRGRLRPGASPALQRDPGGKPGAYRAQCPGP